MIAVKVTFENGDTVNTHVNATFEEAEQYYLDNYFNVGNVGDNMQKCVKVEQIVNNSK